MRTVFADSGYWIAMCNPSDELHPEAAGVTEGLGPCRIVTSQMVLVEFLNYMGGRGQSLREKAMTVVTRLTDTSSVEVVPQTRDQFDEAAEMYSSRSDKGWSLTDCASFILMEQMNIPEALAHDRDFEQAGFVALLRGRATGVEQRRA